MNEFDWHFHNAVLGKGHTVDHSLFLAQTGKPIYGRREMKSGLSTLQQNICTLALKGGGAVIPAPPYPGTGSPDRHCTVKNPERGV